MLREFVELRARVARVDGTICCPPILGKHS